MASLNLDPGTPVVSARFDHGHWCGRGQLTCPIAIPGQGYVFFDIASSDQDLVVQLTTDEAGDLVAQEPQLVGYTLRQAADG